MKDGNIREVIFNEEEHTYSYRGRQLKGITAAIANKVGKKFPESALLDVAVSYGSQVHKECELWIKEGRQPDTDAGIWLVNELKNFMNETTDKYEAEVRVSDFEGTASNVDIVLHTPDGVYLADIKTGNFDREYCTLQLNAYRVLYEHCYHTPVIGLAVLNTKSRRWYRILKTPDSEIFSLLDKNKD